MLTMIRCIFLFLLVFFGAHVSANEPIQILQEDYYPEVEELTQKIDDGLRLSIVSSQHKLISIEIMDKGTIHKLTESVFEGLGEPDLSSARLKILPTGFCTNKKLPCSRKPIPAVEMSVYTESSDRDDLVKWKVLFVIKNDGTIIRKINVLNGEIWQLKEEKEFGDNITPMPSPIEVE